MKRPKKPTGAKGPVSIGPAGVRRHLIDFRSTKDEVELFIARLFCAGNAGMRPQITRYGGFSGLEQNRENALDFRVETALGPKWLELAEFAPLDQFGNAYDNVPGTWSVASLCSAVRRLIEKKASKRYGPDVILILYATHETLNVPPPVLRAVGANLKLEKESFEAIYFVSPHDQESASTWEVYPGERVDDGPIFTAGIIHVGFKGLTFPEKT